MDATNTIVMVIVLVHFLGSTKEAGIEITVINLVGAKLVLKDSLRVKEASKEKA